MKKTLTQAIMILALFITSSLQAQVTIGSTEAPIQGALLDLKESGTTTKGLGLPRVKLTAMNDITNGDITGVTATNADDHIGLLIYHIGEQACESIPSGIYVWDGEQWQAIGQTIDGYMFTDSRDGESYWAGSFGAAGDWMLENLRYLPTTADFTHTAAVSTTNKYYCYPMKGALFATYNPTQAQADWEAQWGLLYNWQAATNGENASILNEGQGQLNEGPATPIQGICPSGWHLPSDKEWNELEKVLTESADQYASGSYTSADKTWQSAWETTSDARGNIQGIVMKSICKPSGSTTETGGESFPVYRSGFNAILLGMADDNRCEEFGRSAYFWSSSSLATNSAWGRVIGYDYDMGIKHSYLRRGLGSVRCKKD